MDKLLNNKHRNIIILDFFVIFIASIVIILNIKDPIITSKTFNLNGYVYYFAFPTFLVAITFLGFGLFAEYKYNKLCLKNIVLLFSGIIFLDNLLMCIILPSHFQFVTYNNITYTMDITLSQRLISIVLCGSICISPYILMYVIPKSLHTKKSIVVLISIYLGLTIFFVLISFIVDFNSYIRIIKSGFTDYSKPATSILFSKFTFSLFLFIGIVASAVLNSLTKKKRFIFIAIFLCFINIFTYSKLQILLSFLFLFIFLFIKLYPTLFKDKNNRMITFMCLGFALCLGVCLIVMIINSQSGFLFKIKKIFQNVVSSSKATFSSRMTIWQSALNTLGPLEYIFGYGFYIGDLVMNKSYYYNPERIEEVDKIMHSHNAFVECIQLGGILYLLYCIFIIAVFIKYILIIRKKYKTISNLMFAFIGFILINDVTDSMILFSDSQYIVFSSFFSLIIMGLYYYSFDEKELSRKKEIFEYSKKIKILNSDKLIIKLDKKLSLFIGNCIKEDKNLISRMK